MINLCWIEDGEWKQLELHYDQATREEVDRIEKLDRKLGQPIAFLEHPVTYMLIPLFSTLLPVGREVFRENSDEAEMNRNLARFIDSRDRLDRAIKHVSWELQLANRDAQIARLEAEVTALQHEANELGSQI